MEQSKKDEIAEFFEMSEEMQKAENNYRMMVEETSKENMQFKERHFYIKFNEELIYSKGFFPKLNSKFSREEMEFLVHHCFAKKYGKIELDEK